MKILHCPCCGGHVRSEDLVTGVCLFCGNQETLVEAGQVLDEGVPNVIPVKIQALAARSALAQPEAFQDEPHLLLVPFWVVEGCYRFAYYTVMDLEHGFGASEHKQRVVKEWPGKTACLCGSSSIQFTLNPLSDSCWARSEWEKAEPCKVWLGTRLEPNLTADDVQVSAQVLLETEALAEANREVNAIEMFRGRYELQSYQLFYRPFYCFRSQGGKQILVDAVSGKEVRSEGAPEQLTPPPKEAPCPGCDALVPVNSEAISMVCQHCHTEVLLHNRTFQPVAKHCIVPTNVSEEQVRQKHPRGKNWKLTFLPFWNVKGHFSTDFLAHKFHSGLFRATLERNRNQQSDRDAVVMIPAGPLASQGVSWEAATSVESVEFPQLNFDFQAQTFEQSAVPPGAEFEHATVPQEQAGLKAIEVMHWLQRDQLHIAYEDLELMRSEAKVQESYLLHLPVYVGTDKTSGQRLAVEAHTGRTLHHDPAEVKLKAPAKPRYLYARLLLAVVLSISSNYLFLHLWNQSPAGNPLVLLLMALLPQVLAYQLFMFSAKDPRSILEVERFDSISVFDPLLTYRQNRQGVRGFVAHTVLLIAATLGPLWLLLGPPVVFLFPLGKAILGKFSGKSFFKVYFAEQWEMIKFCLRTGALIITAAILLWNSLWACWTALSHAL